MAESALLTMHKHSAEVHSTHLVRERCLLSGDRVGNDNDNERKYYHSLLI